MKDISIWASREEIKESRQKKQKCGPQWARNKCGPQWARNTHPFTWSMIFLFPYPFLHLKGFFSLYSISIQTFQISPPLLCFLWLSTLPSPCTHPPSVVTCDLAWYFAYASHLRVFQPWITLQSLGYDYHILPTL